MRLATREEIYSIDKTAALSYGLSSTILIERAGRALLESFEEIFFKQNWSQNSRIAVWCGTGNNGADGRVLAHLLREKNYSVRVCQGTAWSPEDFDIIIDALFGVGLNRPLESEYQKQIERLNQSQRFVVAVDLPSGLDANTGTSWGAIVKARWTLTLALAKPGLFLNEGPSHAGHVISVDLGFPPELLKENAKSVFLVGAESARRLMPNRAHTANKSHFGHLLVLAGSKGMEGAAALVGEAAARMGCGYISLCSQSAKVYRRCPPDFLQLDLKDFFKSDLKKYSAVIVGPGLGLHPSSRKILEHLFSVRPAKVLLDADALTLLSQNWAYSVRNLMPETWLLTPHAGELSRILGVPARELEQDRLKSVEFAQNRLKSLVLFKGFRTVLGAPGKRYIVGSGNVGLAKAGSGDVLAGFIGSLMAQGLDSLKAAALGAYLHGRIADDWLRRAHSTRTLMASDLPELIDASLRGLKKNRR